MTIRVNPNGGMGVLILCIYTVLPGGVCPMYRESIKGSPLVGEESSGEKGEARGVSLVVPQTGSDGVNSGLLYMFSPICFSSLSSDVLDHLYKVISRAFS